MIDSAQMVRRALFSLLVVATTAGAQAGSVPSDSTRRLPLFTTGDLWIAGGFALGTVAMLPLDQRIAKELQRPETQASRATKHAADVFNAFGDPNLVIVGVGVYGIGRLAGIASMADLGLHATEAIVGAAAITRLIKRAAGRQRPYFAGVDDADDFAFGRGGRGDYASFPSGHATAAFAAATVLTFETKRMWPRATKYVAPVAYGSATVVGLARLYSNQHWASDVVMGAGIGTFTALKVIRFNHTRPRNRLDRWLLGGGPTVTPSLDGRGASLTWSIATDIGRPR